jgi:CTD kinase subunit beta
MLEASGFDFRNRHPQDLLIKFLKHYSFEKTSPMTKLAYSISLDLYRTWAPLKQTTATMVFACLELAGRLLDEPHERVWQGKDYAEWKIERGMVMETLLDLLELYTHHRAQSVIGPEFPMDRFLEVRIPLNQESEEKKIPRFGAWYESTKDGAANGVNGAKKIVSPRDVTSPRRGGATNHASTPAETRAAAGGAPAGVRQRAGERGREGTVRFILNPDREREERMIVDTYHRP